MNKRGKRIVVVILSVVALSLAMALGWMAALQSEGTRNSARQTAGAPETYTGAPDMAVSGLADAKSSVAAPPTTGEQLISAPAPMVIRTASMAVRVDDVDKGVRRIREIAAENLAEVTDLVANGGDGTPRPLNDPTYEEMPAPASAEITIRVPAERLTALQAQVAKLGRVTSESSSENDVTQQHVDLSARIKNLRAEEERLRSFLDKAVKVSEMLDVERELARVRGDIESMQAQIDYLERQTAKSTLVVSLSEPSPIASPGSGGWGFDTALHEGVLATAAMARAIVTVAVPLAAIAVPVVLIWIIVRTLVVRRRRSHRADSDTNAADADDTNG